MEQRRQGFEHIMRHQTGRDGYVYTDAYLAVAEVFRVKADSFKATRKLPQAKSPEDGGLIIELGATEDDTAY